MSLTRESIFTGTVANDGTGDTLRSGADKINNNFGKLFYMLGGDSDVLTSSISLVGNDIVFEGSTANAFETFLRVIDPTADRIIKLPDISGIVVLDSATQTLLNKTLDSAELNYPIINSTDTTKKYFIRPAGALADNRNITLPVLTSNDTFVFAAATQTLTNKSLSIPNITSPNITSGIFDANGANWLDIQSVASAQNNVAIYNAVTSSYPMIEAAGTDSNVGIHLRGKGTGAIIVGRLAKRSITIMTDGAVTTGYSHVDCNKGTALALTLANGISAGEEITFTNRGAGTATVTPASFAHGTSFALAQNEGCTVTWDGLKWFITGNYSVVTIA